MSKEIEIVYDKRYKGRRLIVVRHHIPAFLTEDGKVRNYMDWFCGYMEVLPVDKAYQAIKDGADYITYDFDEEYPGAIYGITWADHFPLSGVDQFNYYVGFDTNHYSPDEHKFTKHEVIQALKKMAKGCQK